MSEKICHDHGVKICEGIDQRGLGKLVGGVVDDRGVRFDPLKTVEDAIWFLAFSKWGLRSIMQNPEGSDRCPLCEADRRDWRDHCGSGQQWIDNFLNLAKREAMERGLLWRTPPKTRVAFTATLNT